MKLHPIQLPRSAKAWRRPGHARDCQKTHWLAVIMAPWCAQAPKLRTVKRPGAPQSFMRQRCSVIRTPSWASGARRPKPEKIHSSKVTCAPASSSGVSPDPHRTSFPAPVKRHCTTRAFAPCTKDAASSISPRLMPEKSTRQRRTMVSPSPPRTMIPSPPGTAGAVTRWFSCTLMRDRPLLYNVALEAPDAGG